MEELKEVILYYKDYLIKKEKVNLYEVKLETDNIIKEYLKNCQNELRLLEKLNKKYKLYDDNYDDFMISMGRLALYLEKIRYTDKNNQEIKDQFLNMHNIFEDLEQKNIIKDIYVWKFIGKGKEI